MLYTVANRIRGKPDKNLKNFKFVGKEPKKTFRENGQGWINISVRYRHGVSVYETLSFDTSNTSIFSQEGQIHERDIVIRLVYSPSENLSWGMSVGGSSRRV